MTLSASAPGAKRESVLKAMNRLMTGQWERVKPCPTQFSYKWQQGLQAVNQTSDNLVRRSTNEPLSAEKEDTTPQTIEWVNAIVYEYNSRDGKGELLP